ncbi:MAG: cold shock domain-containing protein [Holosporaceae bacterium]|nr:cold shock domain-containing protein [Holosporaceae bacterium]
MKKLDVLKEVTGRIRWFSQFKGYGFVAIENISEDAFLHFSIIEQSKINRLNNDDIILCDIAESSKGYQVTYIQKLIKSTKYEETANIKTEKVTGVMKWFNSYKGFGFARLNSEEDVFIHGSLLKKYRLRTIEHGTEIKMVIQRTKFGYEATDLVVD